MLTKGACLKLTRPHVTRYKVNYRHVEEIDHRVKDQISSKMISQVSRMGSTEKREPIKSPKCALQTRGRATSGLGVLLSYRLTFIPIQE